MLTTNRQNQDRKAAGDLFVEIIHNLVTQTILLDIFYILPVRILLGSIYRYGVIEKVYLYF